MKGIYTPIALSELKAGMRFLANNKLCICEKIYTMEGKTVISAKTVKGHKMVIGVFDNAEKTRVHIESQELPIGQWITEDQFGALTKVLKRGILY